MHTAIYLILDKAKQIFKPLLAINYFFVVEIFDFETKKLCVFVQTHLQSR